MKNSGILAFLGGALLGATVAILIAPKSGKETRQIIRDFVDDEVLEPLEKGVRAMERKMKPTVKKATSTAKETVHTAKKAVDATLSELK